MQSGHSIAEFAHKHFSKFQDWINTSNYLISLSVDNEDELQKLYLELTTNDADVIAFHEPDIGNQMTAICFFGTPEMRKITQSLDLALKEHCCVLN